MKTSVIRHRVADFLRQYPPFDSIPAEDLLGLASNGRVHFFESECYIFEQGQPRKNVIWVIQQGAVELWDEVGSRQLDLLGAGDILGIDRYFGDSTHAASARTASDVILYSIDAAQFGGLVERSPEVNAYLAAHIDAQARAASLPTWVQAAAPPLECLPFSESASLPEAPAGETSGAYFLRMLRTGETALRLMPPGRELCLDTLALFAGQNPVRLAEALRRSNDSIQWTPLLRLADRMTLAGLDPYHAARLSAPIATHLHTSFLGAAIGEASAQAANEPHIWLVFGRAAREEMLAQRCSRLGIVHGGRSGDLHHQLERVLQLFGSCGLPQANGADDILPPVASAAAWIESLSQRIRDPITHSLYAARMMLDMRPVRGDQSLFRRLQDELESELRHNDAWLPLLANDTLSRLPPLAFFGGLVVDLDGARRESLDLFSVAVQPIVDAARVLSLAQGKLSPVRTIDRLDVARSAYPEAEEIFVGAMSAFEVALFYQARANWGSPQHTAKVRPGDLSRHDQRVLKTAFQSVHRLLEWTAETFVP